MASTALKRKVAQDIEQANRQGRWHSAGRIRYHRLYGKWPDFKHHRNGTKELILSDEDEKGYFSSDGEGNIQTGQTRTEAETTPEKPYARYKYEEDGKVKTASELSQIPEHAKGVVDNHTRQTISKTERTNIIKQDNQTYKQVGQSYVAYGKTKGERVAHKVATGQKVVASDLIDRGGTKLTERNLNTVKQAGYHVHNSNVLKKNKKKQPIKKKKSILGLTSSAVKQEFNQIVEDNTQVPNTVKKEETISYLNQTGKVLFSESAKGAKKGFNSLVEKWAGRLYDRERNVNTRAIKSRKNIGLYDALNIKKDDSNLSFAGKYAGNALYGLTLGAAETVDRIALTAEKAGLYTLISTGDKLKLLNNQNQYGYEHSKKQGRKAAIQSVNPLNRMGLANVLTAAVGAGYTSYTKVYKTPTFHTTGKLVGKQKITAKSQVTYTKTGTNLKNNAFTPKGKQTVTFGYNEQLGGFFNRVLGRKVKTTLKRMPDGTLKKTQQVGKTVYKTTTKPGEAHSVVQKFIKGKLKHTRRVKADDKTSGRLQVEQIGEVATKPSVKQLAKNVITQEKRSTQIYDINAKINKNQAITGKGYQQNVRIATTKASYAKNMKTETTSKVMKVDPSTKSPAINGARQNAASKIKGIGIEEGQLSIGKGKATHETFISVNKKPVNAGVDLFQDAIVGKAKIDQSFYQKPKVDTGFIDVSVFNAETNAIKNGGFNPLGLFNMPMGKRGSLGGYARAPPLSELYSPKISISTIETPTGSFKVTLPHIQASGAYSTPGYAFPISSSVFSTKEAENTFSRDKAYSEFKPIMDDKSKVRVQPTIEYVHDSPYRIKHKEKVKTQQKTRTQPKIVPVNKHYVKQIGDTSNKVLIDQIQDVDTVTQQIKKPILTPKHKFKPFQFIRPQLNEPYIYLPQTISLPGFENKRKKGYDVFVRKKGKNVKVNTGALSKSDAINFGTHRVGNTSAASFEIKESLGSISQTFNQKGIMSDFFAKGNRFIEKVGKRISTDGEKQEITFKGLFNLRNKRKVRKFGNL